MDFLSVRSYFPIPYPVFQPTYAPQALIFPTLCRHPPTTTSLTRDKPTGMWTVILYNPPYPFLLEALMLIHPLKKNQNFMFSSKLFPPSKQNQEHKDPNFLIHAFYFQEHPNLLFCQKANKKKHSPEREKGKSRE